MDKALETGRSPASQGRAGGLRPEPAEQSQPKALVPNATERFRDRLRDRLQVEVGGRWQLMPGRGETWRQWAFDPFFGLTRIGQDVSDNPRRAVPEGGPELRFLLDSVEDGKVEETGLVNTRWISRVFWLRFGCRVLGLDLGVGVYLRRNASDKLAAKVSP